ncbi:MAG: hypothetical protein HY369_02055 [Candidatus Aenigmarchaeota archaeon]|nr:hypothetical protein [Candidatus Aenigmarchaeota archaeon]
MFHRPKKQLTAQRTPFDRSLHDLESALHELEARLRGRDDLLKEYTRRLDTWTM